MCLLASQQQFYARNRSRNVKHLEVAACSTSSDLDVITN